jgi:predicted HAD superfamily Cof-like phosphohydrolase
VLECIPYMILSVTVTLVVVFFYGLLTATDPPQSMYECVMDFHERFDCYIGEDGPAIPPASVVRLRRSLIEEEFIELMKAMEDGDLVAIADAGADLHYVVSGAMIVYGIPEDEVFDEVHRSNMDKAEPDGTVHRREDGKILKAERWTHQTSSASSERQVTKDELS